MKTYLVADPVRYPRMTTAELRSTFLLESLYEPGAIHLNYVDLDRAVVGMVAPLEIPLDHIERNPWQTRKHFDEGLLDELARSIVATGVVQGIELLGYIPHGL